MSDIRIRVGDKLSWLMTLPRTEGPADLNGLVSRCVLRGRPAHYNGRHYRNRDGTNGLVRSTQPLRTPRSCP